MDSGKFLKTQRTLARPDQTDAILTAEEIAGFNLEGADWACYPPVTRVWSSGNRRAQYREFLTLWKNADPDLRILKEAKAEYAKLQ